MSENRRGDFLTHTVCMEYYRAKCRWNQVSTETFTYLLTYLLTDLQ